MKYFINPIILAVVIFLGFCKPVYAQSTVWLQLTGNWGQASNWTNGVPQASGTANIRLTGLPGVINPIIDASTGGAVSNTTNIGPGNSATVTVNSGGSWNNSGNVNIDTTQTLTINGGSANIGGMIVLLSGNASVNLFGGILTTQSVVGSNSAFFLFNGGTLAASASGNQIICCIGPGGTTLGSNGGTINMGSFTNLTMGVRIGGNGNLTFQGSSGSLAIIGDNTYTGTTFIQGGNLQIGNASNDGFIAGNIVNNSNLIFVNTPRAIPGVISGVGTVQNNTTGITILGGQNTYSGSTFLNSGILGQGTTNAFSPNSNVSMASGATLDLRGFNGTIGALSGPSGAIVTNNGGAATLSIGNTSANGTFSGVLEDGSGQLFMNKVGNGTQVLTGNNTYTGATRIDAGQLTVTGRLASANVIINSNGILRGTGTLAGNVLNSGVLSPGTSSGTITINGSYTQLSDGTLLMELDSDTSFDQVIVGGPAFLDGVLEVVTQPDFTPDPDAEFTILTAAGGVNGTFSDVIINEDLGLNVIYTPNDVILAQLFTGTTPLEESIAEALNELIAEGELSPELLEIILALLSLPADEIAAELDQLAPVIAVSIKDILFNVTNAQYGQMTDRLAALRAGASGITLQGLSVEPMQQQMSKHEATLRDRKGNVVAYQNPEPSPWNIFASAAGVFSKITNVSDLPNIRSTTGYFSTGADCQINRYMNAGTYVGYQGIRATLSNNSWLRSNGVKFGFYGTGQWNGFYLNALVGGGYSGFNLASTINIVNMHQTFRGNPNVWELDSLLGGGYEFNLGNWRFGANNSIQYTYLGISAFTSHGGPENRPGVRMDRQYANSLMYTLGGSVSYIWEAFPNCRIIPTVGLSWQHEFLNYERNAVGAFLDGAGPSFIVPNVTGARNQAFGTAGIAVQLRKNIGGYFYYNPQFGGGQITSHAILVGMNYNF